MLSSKLRAISNALLYARLAVSFCLGGHHMFRSIQILLVLFFFSAQCFAQSSGRLDDGRAYRTGPSGFKIMDEVAELEVAKADMKRQILILEDELEQKDALIERLGGAQHLNSGSLVEKDLLERTSSGLPKAMTAEDVKKKEQLCGSVVGRLNREVETLKRQVDNNARVQNTETNSKIASLESQLQNLQSTQASKEGEIARLNQVVMAKENQSQVQESLEVARLKQEVTNLKDQLSVRMSDKDSETASLHSRLQLAQQSNADLQNQIGSLQSRIATVENSRAQLVQPVRTQPVRVVSRAVSPPVASRAVVSRAGKFKKDLRVIQSKILKRKSNIDRLKKVKKGISIPARKLRTSAGVSLDTLRSEIRNGGQMSSSEIESSLREIVSILNEDIRTTGRLLR